MKPTTRRNIIISRQNDLQIAGADVTNSFENAFELCKNVENVFVIGGVQIFKEALPLAHVLYLTLIHHNFDADTFFPEIDKNNWIETESISHEPDEKNTYAYTFIKYRKA